MNQKIKEYLIGYFNSVYCDNCNGGLDDSKCEDCHRKAMNWGLSDEGAEQVTNDLEEIIRNGVNEDADR